MDIEQARLNMIQQQIRTWEVLDQQILDLLNDLRREEFIPAEYKDLAFADTRIPIGHDQTTMTPKVEARLLQSLRIKPDDRVLEIGTGCGYLTCLLARTAAHVKSIDIFPDFIDTAHQKVQMNGSANIDLECRDAYSLLDTNEKYDIVVFTASLPHMDNRFLNLLENNGRMFVIVGESPAMEARIITKQSASDWSYEGIFESDLPALIGSEQKDAFEF